MNARNAYMGQMVSTAGPARLLVMLLERLGLDVARAVQCQENQDFAGASTHLLHAQEIVLELRSSLRPDVWEGAAGLDAIYAWLHTQLVRANTSRDVGVTRDAQRVVEPLVETWREAALVSAAAG